MPANSEEAKNRHQTIAAEKEEREYRDQTAKLG